MTQKEDDVEDLIKDIQERTGLPADKVLEVVTMVTDYMKSVLPDDLVHMIASYLGNAAEQAGSAAGSARSRGTTAAGAAASGASEVVGIAAGAASQAFNVATRTISEIANSGKTEDA